MLITVLLCQQCTVTPDILQSKAVHAQNFFKDVSSSRTQIMT